MPIWEPSLPRSTRLREIRELNDELQGDSRTSLPFREAIADVLRVGTREQRKRKGLTT